MNNYFRKLTTFDLDRNKLYTEWHNVAMKYNIIDTNKTFGYGDYYWMLINYPIDRDENFYPIVETGKSEEIGSYIFSIDNIITDFKNTYTVEVARIVYDYLNLKLKGKYRVNSVQYRTMGPKSIVPTHRDPDNKPRFFLIASASEGCYMEIAGEKVPMHEIGSLFQMNIMAPHSAVNDTDEHRVTMVFDVVHI